MPADIPYVTSTWTHVFGTAASSFVAVAPPNNPNVPASVTRVWSDWLPRKLYINGARLGHQAYPGSMVGQAFMALDRGGVQSAQGAVYGGEIRPDGSLIDYTVTITPASLFASPNEPQDRQEHWWPPIYADLDIDVINIQWAGIVPDQWFAQINFLVPAPDQPVLPLVTPPPPPPPEPGWNVSAFASPSGSSNYAGYTFVQSVDASAIIDSTGGDLLRVTVKKGTPELAIDKLLIGPKVAGGNTPTSLTALPLDTTNTDASVLIFKGPAVDAPDGYVIKAHVVAGAVAYGANLGWQGFYIFGDHAESVDNSGVTNGASVLGVSKIERHHP